MRSRRKNPALATPPPTTTRSTFSRSRTAATPTPIARAAPSTTSRATASSPPCARLDDHLGIERRAAGERRGRGRRRAAPRRGASSRARPRSSPGSPRIRSRRARRRARPGCGRSRRRSRCGPSRSVRRTRGRPRRRCPRVTYSTWLRAAAGAQPRLGQRRGVGVVLRERGAAGARLQLVSDLDARRGRARWARCARAPSRSHDAGQADARPRRGGTGARLRVPTAPASWPQDARSLPALRIGSWRRAEDLPGSRRSARPSGRCRRRRRGRCRRRRAGRAWPKLCPIRPLTGRTQARARYD